jgi:lysozyme family protein
MASGNLPACLAITLPHEGGWSDHPKDPGGATMKGITLNTYRRWKPGATKYQLSVISHSEVEMIYRDGFWKPVRGDQLPAGVDAAVFDYGVNSGPPRAIKEMQRVLGTTADGEIGPATMGKLRVADGKRVIQKLCARRLSFMQSLKIWNTFKRGWARRVADVEAKSVAMYWKSRGFSDISEDMEYEAVKADKAASKQTTAATTTAGGGVTAGGAETVVSGDINWLLLGGIAAVVIIAVVILASRVTVHRERATAYRAAAAS